MSPSQTLTVQTLAAPTRDVLEAMVRLFQQGQRAHHAAFPDHFGPANDTAPIAQYCKGFFKPRNPLRGQSGFALGWFVDGALSGYLLYRLSRSHNIFYGKARWTCFIEDIVVDEGARGLGGGSAMMEALSQRIAPLENCAVSGTVWAMNSASEALFRKHGFEPLSQGFYKVKP